MPVKALARSDTIVQEAPRELAGDTAGRPGQEQDQQSQPLLEYIVLKDGRRLAYSSFGRSDGFPLLYFHSAGSSRLECGLFADSARRLGYRLIAADRPGIGCSDFRSGLKHRDICEEMLALADHLGVAQFGLMSHSSGGVFALAMAHRYPARVSFVLSLGGMTGNLNWKSGTTSLLAGMIQGVLPGLIGYAIRLRHSLVRTDVPGYMERLQAELSYTDRKALADPGVWEIMLAAMNESVRQGAQGLARDNSLCFEDPGFSLQQIRVPVAFWQGRADTLCSRSFNEYLATRIPTASCHSVANCGHFFFIHCMDEIFGRTRLFTRQSLAQKPV